MKRADAMTFLEDDANYERVRTELALSRLHFAWFVIEAFKADHKSDPLGCPGCRLYSAIQRLLRAEAA